MNMATSSIGIKLYRGETALTNLLEIPELGGTTESIEITTLADEAHMYMEGLKNYGESLDFKFLYEGTQFDELNKLNGIQEWKVELPDGAKCSFSGASSVRLESAGIAAALTYILSIKPSSEMMWNISA